MRGQMFLQVFTGIGDILLPLISLFVTMEALCLVFPFNGQLIIKPH